MLPTNGNTSFLISMGKQGYFLPFHLFTFSPFHLFTLSLFHSFTLSPLNHLSNQLFPIPRQHINNRNLNHSIASRLQTHGGASHINQHLRR